MLYCNDDVGKLRDNGENMVLVEEIKQLETACKKLQEERDIYHVGVVNSLGRLIAGGFKNTISPIVDDEKVRMIYMQMQLDFKMRKELDEILGEIDYIASRRTNYLSVNVPIGDNLVIIMAKPNSNDKKIVKKAESLFDEIEIRSFSYEL